jgi:hypothetical protein
MFYCKFNVLRAVHCAIFVQQEPTGCTIYFQFISLINLYMFRAGLQLIVKRYYSVYTEIGISHASRRVFSTVVRHCVWFRILVNEEAMAHWGLLRQNRTKKKKLFLFAKWRSVMYKSWLCVTDSRMVVLI